MTIRDGFTSADCHSKNRHCEQKPGIEWWREAIFPNRNNQYPIINHQYPINNDQTGLPQQIAAPAEKAGSQGRYGMSLPLQIASPDEKPGSQGRYGMSLPLQIAHLWLHFGTD